MYLWIASVLRQAFLNISSSTGDNSTDTFPSKYFPG